MIAGSRQTRSAAFALLLAASQRSAGARNPETLLLELAPRATGCQGASFTPCASEPFSHSKIIGNAIHQNVRHLKLLSKNEAIISGTGTLSATGVAFPKRFTMSAIEIAICAAAMH